MHHIYSIETFEEQPITCDCGWEGLGKDADLEPLMLTDEIEIYCPDCGNYLGLASASGDAKGQSFKFN